ncbi:hypothetical protein MMC28_007549 [Mycoblastus sanguinarius]|nr:hypothetical protein [Mycoblastus sanguinarius]
MPYQIPEVKTRQDVDAHFAMVTTDYHINLTDHGRNSGIRAVAISHFMRQYKMDARQAAAAVDANMAKHYALNPWDKPYRRHTPRHLKELTKDDSPVRGLDAGTPEGHPPESGNPLHQPTPPNKDNTPAGPAPDTNTQSGIQPADQRDQDNSLPFLDLETAGPKLYSEEQMDLFEQFCAR